VRFNSLSQRLKLSQKEAIALCYSFNLTYQFGLWFNLNERKAGIHYDK
jgi:hypothetical protein